MKILSWSVWRTWALGMGLGAASRVVAQPGPMEWGPVAWYRFENPANLGEDSSGQKHHGVVSEATGGPGYEGQGLVLDGRGGLEVPLNVCSAKGFTLDCWVRFASVADNMNLISQEDTFLLRLDPPSEGSTLSFFVNVGGRLEPRVRGLTPVPGRWYHLVATWDGLDASLRLNGQLFQNPRAGSVPPTEAPVLLGKPSRWGPVGLKGVLDEVKLYPRALRDGEVVLQEYGLEERVRGPFQTAPRFEFEAGCQGWEPWHAGPLRTVQGRLRATLQGYGSALVHRRLRLSVRDRCFVSLRMAVTRGQRGRLVFRTTQGTGERFFPVKGDGQMHSYVLSMDDQPEWDGTLTALALAPSESEGQVELEFLRLSRDPEAPPEVTVRTFLPDRPVNRAGRLCSLTATIHNTGGEGRNLAAVLVPPAGLEVVGPARQAIPVLRHGETRALSWQVRAPVAMAARLQVRIAGPGVAPARAELAMAFTPPVELPRMAYVPEPQVAPSRLLVGAHYCPLWKQGSRSAGWEQIVPYPEREPVLGWYDEDNPEVTDWEIKWALEHGISFFVYCWYRRSQGRPVEMFLSHAIHEGLFRARYADRFKFCIMWENQTKGQSGVASEEDLLNNLLPFWIENYFRHPSYLKIDNKPLLFIYRPEFLVEDLGSVEDVRRALDRMRQACRQAGFDGLILLGEYRGLEPAPLQLMADEGLDYSFAYCWPVGGNPAPEAALQAQESYWRRWQELGRLPYLLTVSMGWDSTPWSPSFSIWRLPPPDFEALCRRAREVMATLAPHSLGSQMVLLDNWNEFGEGHYISPHRQYGFGYLDAVRAAFTESPAEHTDLVPEDVGLGPYDQGYRQYAERLEQCARRVVAPQGVEPKLVAWWTFDEPDGSPCALDYTGHGQGGLVKGAERGPGVRGRALACHGGSVTVPPGALRFPLRAITVEAWIRTDAAGQTDKWFVNNVYGNGDAGFRLGLSEGKLCWAIPKTRWSHHLVANEPLPLGRWVHVAATYDGEVMRLYMDGWECGSLERGGKIRPTESHTCLGSYDTDHPAFFVGLLDEVKIHARALTAQDIRNRAKH